MAHVLIGFAEALPAAEVLFSLRNAGHEVSIFASKSGTPLEYLSPKRLIVLPDPARDSAAAIATLKAVMTASDAPDVILPLDDNGLWLIDKALGDDPRCAGATGQRVNVSLDKALQIAIAQRVGLPTPPTIAILKPDDLDKISTFPTIIKPALAVREREGRLGKGDATYLMQPKDTAALKATLDEGMEPLIAQPLIEGIGEGVFGHATSEGIVAWSGHRRGRMMNPHGSGSSACISLMPDADLRDQVAAFITSIGWRGPFMMEMLRDAEGTAWFMELNGRMWGSLALARRQGLEYPAWAVASTISPEFQLVVPKSTQSSAIQRHLGRDLLHLLFVLRGPKTDFHRKGWPRFWRSALGVFKPTHPRAFYNYDPSHRSYFLRDALWTMRKAFRK